MRHATIAAAAVLTICRSARRDTACRALTERALPGSAIVQSEFLFETAPFPSVHASTIAETREGLVAAWFGGTREGAPDVGIWVSRHVKGAWTAPVEVATGVQPDGTRHPCWNPVLVRDAGPLARTLLQGRSRSAELVGRRAHIPRRRTDVERRPAPARRDSGTDQEQAGPTGRRHDHQPEQHRVQRQAESLAHPFRTVRPTRARRGPSCGRRSLPNAPELHAIQPSILVHPGGRLQAVGRTRSERVFQTWSEDGGKTWSPLTLTTLPNPSAGTDATTLRDGRQLIVYNHTPKGRSPLNVALSRDGTTWEAALVLESEPGEYSYPAVIQTADGKIHVTYTWKRQTRPTCGHRSRRGSRRSPMTA